MNSKQFTFAEDKIVDAVLTIPTPMIKIIVRNFQTYDNYNQFNSSGCHHSFYNVCTVSLQGKKCDVARIASIIYVMMMMRECGPVYCISVFFEKGVMTLTIL